MKHVPIVRKNETIETRDLRVFAQVAELRSVTGAAAALGLPKSVVSKLLARTERRLGVLLLERSSRRIEITAAGRLLLLRARSVLGELDALSEDLRALQDDVRGRLVLAAPPDLAAHLAAGFFPAFLAAHAGVQLSLSLDYGYADLMNPDLDLAIRIGAVQDERLVAKPIGTLRRILVASPAFGKCHSLDSVADLARVPALIFSEGEGGGHWRLTDGRRSLEVEVSGAFQARSFPVLLRAAAAGLGVAQVPELMVQDELERGSLQRVLPAYHAPDAPILLVHRFAHHRVRRVAAFLAFARENAASFLPAATPSARRARPAW